MFHIEAQANRTFSKKLYSGVVQKLDGHRSRGHCNYKQTLIFL